MTIKEAKRIDGGNVGKMAMYMLTSDPAVSKVKDLVGQHMRPEAYAFYEDVNADGVITEVLAVTDGEKTVATVSDTFKREFERCLECAAGAPFEIELITGKSKNGRDYVSCRMVWVEE